LERLGGFEIKKVKDVICPEIYPKYIIISKNNKPLVGIERMRGFLKQKDELK